MSFSKFKWLRVLLINLLILISGLVIVELTMGQWMFGTSYGRLVIPRNIKQQFNVSDLYQEDRTLYIRDQYGLRGQYGELEDINILTVGGSTTNELFITEGKTWSDQLAEAFRDKEKDVRVANAGVDGQTTIGHLKNFELWFSLIPELKPQYVILYVGINDSALANGHPITQQDHMKNNKRPIRQYLKNNSIIYNTYLNLQGFFLAYDAKLIHGGDSPNKFEYAYPIQPFDINARLQEISEALSSYKTRLRKLAKYIRGMGAEPIIVTQPAAVFRINQNGDVMGRVINGKVSSQDLRDHATLFGHNRTAMNLCNQVDGICIDLANELKLKPEDYYDGIHTTPSGSSKIAKFLFDQLQNIVAH